VIVIAVCGMVCGCDGPTAIHRWAANRLGALHVVSAWASEEGIALGQVATEEKSNEIAAIPQLLEQIDPTHALVAIDAMGCQKAIAAHFEHHLERDLEELRYRSRETTDEGHGRQDDRSYFLTKAPADFALQKEWPWIKAIGYAVRITQHADGRESGDVRYCASSRYLSGKRFSEAVRGHWSIESMHWVLDAAL
jgi:predicted transposase YbfD/YdcC